MRNLQRENCGKFGTYSNNTFLCREHNIVLMHDVRISWHMILCVCSCQKQNSTTQTGNLGRIHHGVHLMAQSAHDMMGTMTRSFSLVTPPQDERPHYAITR